MEKQNRCEKGFEIYVESMAKSAEDKAARIIPVLSESLKNCRGDILDLGAGGGDLTETLLQIAREFKVKLLTLDRDPRMIEILKKKFSGQSEIEIVRANALDFNLGRKLSAIICSSLLHEIFSERHDLNEIKQVLKNIYDHLQPGGILISRNGVKPAAKDEVIFLQPLKKETLERFRKVLDFTGASWLKINSYRNLEMKTFLALTRETAYELMVKYQYPEINWPVEMKETFGFWAKEEAKSTLEEIGFNVARLESYLLPYFAEMFSNDFKLFEWKDGPGFVEIPYFDTHLILVARKEKEA